MDHTSMRSKCMLSLIGFAILCLYSCATIPEYPSQLPILIKADERISQCPTIAGRYWDEGVSVSVDGKNLGKISLTQLIHGLTSDISAADQVVVVGPPNDLSEVQSWQGVIEVQSWQGDTQVATWRQGYITADAAVGNSYICEKSFVRLGREYGDGVIIFFVVAHSDFLWLRKAVDGSLIILHRDTNVVSPLFPPIPIPIKSYVAWYRFPPVEEGLGSAPNTSVERDSP